MRLFVCAVAVIFTSACGENPSINPTQSGEILSEQNAAGEVLTRSSCNGPFVSDLTPVKTQARSHSTELLLQGNNKPVKNTADNNTCSELSRYLSTSSWSGDGHQISNDVRLLINFGQHVDNQSKPSLRVNSAKLYFLDGSLSENMANVELRCLGAFSLLCLTTDSDSSSCPNYKISYESQTCTFRGDVIQMAYANHKRSDLKITGELRLNSDGNASMKVDKASWKVMF